MGRWADIRTRVINAVGDISTTEAQAFILDAARELNAEARWYESLLSLGNTVANTGEYDVTDASVVDIYSVMVGGVPYEQATTRDIEEIDAGVSYLYQSGPVSRGVFAPYFNTSGDLKVSLRPTPDTSGTAITARAILLMSVSDWSANDPIFPADFDQVVISGAIALGLSEQDERLGSAAYHRQVFDAGIKRLRSRRASRVGKGAIKLPLNRGVR